VRSGALLKHALVGALDESNEIGLM
jgi:hypothetical protein